MSRSVPRREHVWFTILLLSTLASFPSEVRATGYSFSISASSTDPHQNSTTSTGGVRSVYLWLTCSDDGLSAFEAGVTGTLEPLAFQPANGVINAGGAKDLLLAIPSCPRGPEIDLLLGSWFLQDTGGSLCLSASSKTTQIGGVDCDQVYPLLVLNPNVAGFSSDGSTPCSTGTTGCGPENAPRAVSLEDVRSLEGKWPRYAEVWSPKGPWMLLHQDGGLMVWDSSLPEEAPQGIASTLPVQVVWSPDGAWVAGLFEQDGTSSLQLTVIDVRTKESWRVAELESQALVWTTDGTIHTWNEEGRRVPHQAPDEWTREFEGKHKDVSRLLRVVEQPSLRISHGFFPDANGRKQEQWISRFDGTLRRAEGQILVAMEDALPRGKTFLVKLSGGSHATLLLDENGDTLARLAESGDGGARWTTLSADGEYVVGSGASAPGAPLALGSARGHWVLPIGESSRGQRPRMSKVSNLVAFWDPSYGAVRVSRLLVETESNE